MIKATYDVFNTSITDNVISPNLKRALQDDAFLFGGLKTHAQLFEASKLLLDEEGKVKSLTKLKEELDKLNVDYNRNYLEAEYQFAIQSSMSADQWERSSERYNLQYRTASDDRVREEHKALHGTTLPKDDAFWLEYYPPNGWRCRCRAIQVRKEKYPESNSEEALQKGAKATTQIGKDGKNRLEIFRFNPGVNLKLMPPEHPYNKVQGATEAKNEIGTLTYTKEDEDALFEYFGVDESSIKDADFLSKTLNDLPMIEPVEALSIHEYTFEFYREINNSLRGEIHSLSDSFINSYVKIANSGLDKLPDFKGMVFRQTRLSEELIDEMFKSLKNDIPYFDKGYLSTTTDIKVTEKFNGNVFFAIKSKTGKEVQPFSIYKENEVLFKPETKFKIRKIEKDEETNKYLVYMEEN